MQWKVNTKFDVSSVTFKKPETVKDLDQLQTAMKKETFKINYSILYWI